MRIKEYFKNHYLAVLTALLVGFIYLAPNLFFILSLGGEYKGIPIMQTANEDYYLARIQEILDGHPLVASHGFYEYKDQWPIAPPTSEFFYALPSLLFGVSPVNTLIASRFVLPFILFLLVYFFIRKLTNDTAVFSNKINAIASALFVTLGYDLVDYRTLWSWIMGEAEPGGFLLWARPVNPILGAIFLFSFLILVWKIIRKSEYLRMNIFNAAIFLALMISSYFFSWGIALSVAAILILIYLLKKEFKIARNLIFVVLLAFVLALPYWYLVWQSSQNEWYEESLLRSGLFYTHYPLLNKLMLAVLAVYVILIFFQISKRRKSKPDLNLTNEESIFYFQDWHLFCLVLILGSLWAYSQQIITGRTVWPYHFVQYTIPLAIIVLMALFYNIIRKESSYLWRAGVFLIISASLAIGIYTQANTYQNIYSRYVENQSFAKIFDWLNDKEKDCVVLVQQNGKLASKIEGLIPAFTHCNVYTSSWVYTLMPSRPQFNYAVVLRLNGVKGEEIDQYLIENNSQAGGYLFSNWLGLYNYPAKDFPDFSDSLLEERLKKFPDDYRVFLKKDFKKELSHYKLDYILSVGPLSSNIIGQLNDAELVFRSDNIFVYSFNEWVIIM